MGIKCKKRTPEVKSVTVRAPVVFDESYFRRWFESYADTYKRSVRELDEHGRGFSMYAGFRTEWDCYDLSANPIVSILPLYEGDNVNVGAQVTLKDGDVFKADLWHGGGFWSKVGDGMFERAIYARRNFVHSFRECAYDLQRLEKHIDKYASLKTDEGCIIFDAQDAPVHPYEESLSKLSDHILYRWSLAEINWNRAVLAFLTWLVSPEFPGETWEQQKVYHP